MAKTHLKVSGVDYRDHGQTEHEYTHQSACGYVRKQVTNNEDSVDCFYCLGSHYMDHYNAVNETFSDSQGCY